MHTDPDLYEPMDTYVPRNPRPTGGRRRRKRRRSGVPAILFIILLLTVAGVLGGVCLLLYRRIPVPQKQLIGTWAATEDLTIDAAQAGQEWLGQAALGNSVHVRDYMPQITLSAELTISEDGSFHESLGLDSYEAAVKNARSGLADALIALIGVRMSAQSTGEVADVPDPDSIRELFSGAAGMSVEEYLSSLGPSLLAPADDYAASCTASGKFTFDEPYMLQFNGQTASYAVTDELLLLPLADGLGRFGTVDSSRVIYHRISGPAQTEALLQPLDDLSRLLTAWVPALPSLTLKAHAKTFPIVENLYCSPGAGTPVIVKAIHADYENNRYVSLRDLASALAGTPREFSVSVDGNSVTIDTGASWQSVGGENDPFDESSSYSAGDLRSNSIRFDGRTVKYYTYIGKNTAGKYDCFINLTDFSLLFNINVEITENGIVLDTSERPLIIDMAGLREDGFYDEMRGGLAGNATTGEIYEECRGDIAVPIASTTKLMTFAVLMDAISAGEISMNDTVVISSRAAKLSQGPDRVVPMEAGQESTVRELMQAMLIASSNESALALAEHAAGSEEAFVERMMKKAAELGLSENTVFNNCNGLPVFEDSVSTAKRQNLMSPEDLFKLASYLLVVYPQITEITSQSNVSLSTLHADLRSTNALLYNVPEVNGLKTGTTNMAGSCIVVSAHINTAGGPQDLISIVLGAEDNTVRFTSSEILIRYAMQCAENGVTSVEETPDGLPADAEGIIRLVLSAA